MTLTRSLRCPGVALHLAGSTQIDLGGFSLRGPGKDSGVPALEFVGWEDPQTLGVRNGTLKDWGLLVSSGGSPTVTTSAVNVADLGQFTDAVYTAVTIESSRYRNAGAIGAFSVTTTRISDSVLSATWLQSAGYGNITVERSTIKDVPGAAIAVSEGIVNLTDSRLTNNGVGISSAWTGTHVSRSVLKSNGVAIQTDSGGDVFGEWTDSIADSTFVDNGTALQLGVNATVTGNDFRRNEHAVDSRTGGSFLEATIALEANSLTHNGDAIYVDGPSSLKDNRAIANTGIGIYTPRATDLGGNVAYRNGVSPQCTGVVCASAPIS
ncbi:hypothetical protein [Cellulomonas sp. URHE0023]|uniref:hypothetical protein n=1 Tax=Cellulomonas sp. URHE0023 TaxID=1380354 RepID=UPI0012DFD9AF|nr:hypothetical protein [Cellulomonas sp. URHE0023]